ncbi:MAG TPA: IS200/IS605 family transposase [Candidatus Kapabacteria bacterium]|nr:IS200/IS605 family transposase [Candidatus Kapabacteria bacterium]
MANSFSQIDIHLVFAVKFRNGLIKNELKEELHKYITGIITNSSCKLIAINSMPDHIHILIGLHPKISLSDLVRDIKSNSSNFLKEKNKPYSFAW